jgi:hypothetical protein
MGIEDAYADMPLSSPPSKASFVRLYGFNVLSAYLLEREATIVYPLLLALHRHLDMAEKRGETEVALTSEVWKDAGTPPKRTRATMLGHLRRMPELVILHNSQTLTFRYYIGKGPAWSRMEMEAGRKS